MKFHRANFLENKWGCQANQVCHISITHAEKSYQLIILQYQKQ